MVSDTGRFSLHAYFSPTLNYYGDSLGLCYAVSIDDEKPQIISINKEDRNVSSWEAWVANNIIIKKSTHMILTRGHHVLKYWMVDPGVVVQKLVLVKGELKPSYLGPPQNFK
jgi:hypothetical protein